MIKPEQIPPEVARLLERMMREGCFTDVALAAALSAWPNVKTLRDDGRRQTYIVPALVLPLAQEKQNGV